VGQTGAAEADNPYRAFESRSLRQIAEGRVFSGQPIGN
jgi:hypothetical protein